MEDLRVDDDVSQDNTSFSRSKNGESKRKRDVKNTSSQNAKRPNTRSSGHVKSSDSKDPLDSTLWKIDSITCPDQCALYNTVELKFRIVTESSYPLSSTSLAPSDKILANGLWFNFSSNARSISKHDFSLSISLQERDEERAVRSVVLCPKCSKKKSQVIELADKMITPHGDGTFTLHVAINEQCAHRASNQFGSPKTRFFFSLQLWGSSKGEEKRNIALASSEMIKVVAPGKCSTKKSAKASVAKSSMALASMNLFNRVETLEKDNASLSTQVANLQTLVSTLVAEVNLLKNGGSFVKLEPDYSQQQTQQIQAFVKGEAVENRQFFYRSNSLITSDGLDYRQVPPCSMDLISSNSLPQQEIIPNESSIDAEVIQSLSQELLERDPGARRLLNVRPDLSQ